MASEHRVFCLDQIDPLKVQKYEEDIANHFGRDKGQVGIGTGFDLARP